MANDFLDAGYGSDTVQAGAGEDEIRHYSLNGNNDVDTIDAGADNDLIQIFGTGADSILTITGGTGQDTYRFYSGSQSGDNQITDFAAGPGGDLLDLNLLLNQSATDGAYIGGNPFDTTIGFFQLLQQGTDTLVQWDRDGTDGTTYTWQTLATLQNTTATNITADNITGNIPPDGGPIPGQTITGTTGNDNPLDGTIGDDEIYGLAGQDRINGSFGNDIIDGGEGLRHRLRRRRGRYD